MEILDEVQFLELLKNNPKIEFVAIVVTPWHAHNADAAISRLAKEYGVKKGVVLILRHKKEKFIISEEAFVNQKEVSISTYHFYEKEKHSKVDKIIESMQIIRHFVGRKKATERPFYILSAGYPYYRFFSIIQNIMPKRKLMSIIFDEGLAMYMRREEDWIGEIAGRTSKIKKIEQYIQRFLVFHYANFKIKKHELQFDWSLLTKGEEGLKINTKTKEYLLLVLKEFTLDKKWNTKVYENKIVFISQPFIEDGDMEMEEVEKLLITMGRVISKNGNVIHKPHPREVFESVYNELAIEEDFLNKGISQECILQKCMVRPKKIVGFSSTALVTAKLLWDIPAISLIKIANDYSVSEKLYNDFLGFERTFSEFVEIPESLEEFEHMISRN